MGETGLRKDAARNRQKLLDAGREVFAERGLDASLNDVAHHAGVGVGTAYRRFANKEELIDALYEQQIDEMETILQEALAEPDAWGGLVHYLEGSLVLQTRDRGMAQILSGHRVSQAQFDWQRDRLAPLVDAVADRARAQGATRPEITGTDLVFIQISITSLAITVQAGSDCVASRDDLDGLYRRYLWLYLDGIRADEGVHAELPVAALATEETHRLLSRRG